MICLISLISCTKADFLTDNRTGAMEDSGFLKKTLRKDKIRERNALPDEWRLLAEAAFLSAFKNFALFKDSKVILLYASFGSELKTDGIIKYALHLGKNVFLPKVMGEDMEFYRIRSFDELSGTGYKGIREPAGNTEKYIYPENIDKTCIIIPGVCFDKEGNRLGYGGGFYDRFLADKPLLLQRSVAVGYQMQETEHIETSEYDLKPSRIMLF